MTWFFFSNEDQAENGIIDDINEIGIDTFTDDGFTIIGKNLSDAAQFHQNKIDKTFLAHVSPRFSIIMVFIQHGILGKFDVLIVQSLNLIRIHFFHIAVVYCQLNKTNYPIIDNSLEFSSNVIFYLLHLFFLKGSDTHGFYENLVCNGYDPETAPGSAIITGFFDEYVFTAVYCQIILCIGCDAHA